jgi:hypothetical protein
LSITCCTNWLAGGGVDNAFCLPGSGMGAYNILETDLRVVRFSKPCWPEVMFARCGSLGSSQYHVLSCRKSVVAC